MKNIDVKANRICEIKVTLKGQEVTLTEAEAEELYVALGKVLNKSSEPLVDVWKVMREMEEARKKQEQGRPFNPPPYYPPPTYTPAPYPKPLEIWCDTEKSTVSGLPPYPFPQ